MMSSSLKKKCIKVSLDGETKRLKMPTSYDNLVHMTYEKFPNQGLEKVVPLKFYYLDDEQELISITSQSDFVEALEIDDAANLKLIVANSANEARSLLEKQLGDTMSMAGSMHQFGATPRLSNIGMGRIETMLDEPVEERRCETERAPNPTNLFDNMKNVFEKTINEFKQIVNVPNAAEPAKTEPLKMPTEVPAEVQKPVEQPEPELINTCSAKKPVEQQPPKEEFNYEGMEEQVAYVKEEIQKLLKGGLKDIFEDRRRCAGQATVVHENFECDDCGMAPIVGIRYKCTRRDDYDLCEKCERKPEHRNSTFLKIRKPHHAPAKLIVKYPDQTCGFPMPDMHVDQTVDLNNLAKTFSSFCGNFGMMPQAPAQPTSDLKMPETDLKMPAEVPPMAQPKAETPIVTKTKQPAKADDDDEYQLEDVSIVEDLTQNEKSPFEEQSAASTKPSEYPVLEELKNWTPKPEIEEQAMTKEEIYKLEAAAESGYLRVGLLQLLELGFSDFQRNKQLMEKFNLNVQAVASAILEDDELYN